MVGAAGLAVVAAPASAVRFQVIGDWGAGTRGQAAVARQMCAQHARGASAFILTVGDNFYPAGTARPSTFDVPMKCLIDAGLTWRAAWGNHDSAGGDSTRTVLGTPARWYTFVSGAARIVVLDSTRSDSTRQRAWLERVLRAETRRPVIVAYHHPTRTAGAHRPVEVQRRLWEPLFLKYRVRLVLQGHNHLYERIRHRTVTYITSGGGGASLYPCARPADGLVKCMPVYQFLVVEVTPKRIAVSAIDRTGSLIDAWSTRFSRPR